MQNYEFYYNQVMKQIEEKGVGVLATSYNDVPTTRMMSFIVYDNRIAFQTSYKLEKYAQIDKNNKVSLCFMNINIQGVAIIDKRQALENETFTKLYKEKHKSSFETYSHMNSNRVIEIIAEKIVLWLYEDGEPYRVFLDVKNKVFRKDIYKHEQID